MFKHNTNIKDAIEFLKNNKNNAISFIFENARNTNGPLSNTTYVLKDNYATKDASTEASSNMLKNFMPYYDATVVKKLNFSGAALIGKSNLDEFALGGSGTFSSKGIITNPLDHTRLVGGSSSGSAAILSDYISFTIGSDTGDSVRLPASYVGKVGFKPTYGAVSRYGLFQYASSLDTVAWFTHNVSDSNEIAKILYGEDKKDATSINIFMKKARKIKPSKIGILSCSNFVDRDIKINFQKLIDKLKERQIIVEIVEIPHNLLMSIKSIYQIISYSEASTNLANLTGISFGNQEQGNNWEEIMLNTRSKNFGYMVQRRLTLGAYFLDMENQQELFLRSQKIRRILKDYVTNLHKDLDFIMFPAAPSIAPKLESNFLEFKDKYQYMPFILTMANLVGNPSITIPWIKDEKFKLPINLTIETNIYEDEKLFSYALYMENFIANIDNVNIGEEDE